MKIEIEVSNEEDSHPISIYSVQQSSRKHDKHWKTQIMAYKISHTSIVSLNIEFENLMC